MRAGACIECLVFAAVSLALVRLRATQPDRPRPYRAPYGARAAIAIAAIFTILAIATVLPIGSSRAPFVLSEHRDMPLTACDQGQGAGAVEGLDCR